MLMSLDLKPLSTRKSFHHCSAIHKRLIFETDFSFNFIKNQAVHNSYNSRRSNIIFDYSYPKLTGENKYLSIFLQKTGTVFYWIWKKQIF